MKNCRHVLFVICMFALSGCGAEGKNQQQVTELSPATKTALDAYLVTTDSRSAVTANKIYQKWDDFKKFKAGKNIINIMNFMIEEEVLCISGKVNRSIDKSQKKVILTDKYENCVENPPFYNFDGTRVKQELIKNGLVKTTFYDPDFTGSDPVSDPEFDTSVYEEERIDFNEKQYDSDASEGKLIFERTWNTKAEKTFAVFEENNGIEVQNKAVLTGSFILFSSVTENILSYKETYNNYSFLMEIINGKQAVVENGTVIRTDLNNPALSFNVTYNNYRKSSHIAGTGNPADVRDGTAWFETEANGSFIMDCSGGNVSVETIIPVATMLTNITVKDKNGHSCPNVGKQIFYTEEGQITMIHNSNGSIDFIHQDGKVEHLDSCAELEGRCNINLFTQPGYITGLSVL